MTAAPKYPLVSESDYLARELVAPERREYVAGVLFAMSCGTSRHATVSGNTFASLHEQLRGKPCRPHGSDLKVRIRSATQLRFYYPDVSVVCSRAPGNQTFVDDPVVVVEVLSPSTRRTDLTEKKTATSRFLRCASTY